ncbi:MAG: DUF72 domain-containing protein [Nitrospiria bacterium]
MDLFGEQSDLELASNFTNLFLGTQGWSYPSWVGSFYPQGTKASDYLTEYAKHFPTVEIDSTFYAIPRNSLIDHLNRSTPEGFIFTAKFPKIITHEKRLKDCETNVKAFLDVMSRLGQKLGPLVLQFDYTFKFEQFDLLACLLEKLPRGHRYAVEIRHRSWLKEEFFALLSSKNIALVLADYAYMPKLDRVTADFLYIRWLGNRKDVPDDSYEKIIRDRTEDLVHWSSVVKGFIEKKIPVYGYFNNHYMGHSPGSIRIFLEMMRKAVRGERSIDAC